MKKYFYALALAATIAAPLNGREELFAKKRIPLFVGLDFPVQLYFEDATDYGNSSAFVIRRAVFYLPKEGYLQKNLEVLFHYYSRLHPESKYNLEFLPRRSQGVHI